MRRRPNLFSRFFRNEQTGRPTLLLVVGVVILLLLIVAVCLRLLLFNGSAPLPGSPGGKVPLPTVAPTPAIPAPQLHIQNNLLVDNEGHIVRLTGANRSGTEYRCMDYSVFDGPNSEQSIDAMLTWHINAIRIPLNEDCWLGINQKSPRYGGDYYIDHIQSYVDSLIVNGITPILDLHWSAPGTQPARQEEPMPDRDHSIAFWQQVATVFRGNNAVIFDLFNEPFPDNDQDTITAWQCWRYGTDPQYCPLGTASLTYNAAGMQDLVNAVRSTGASNVIILGGIQYAATLDQWMKWKPFDPKQELAVSWHLYNHSYCSDSSCWYTEGVPVMKAYPVITGEIGEDDWKGDFISTVMQFLDNPGSGVQPQSYLAWVWNTDQTRYDLIQDYNGTPTSSYGETYMNHLLAIHSEHSPDPPGTPGNSSCFPQWAAYRRGVVLCGQ